MSLVAVFIAFASADASSASSFKLHPVNLNPLFLVTPLSGLEFIIFSTANVFVSGCFGILNSYVRPVKSTVALLESELLTV